MIRDGSPAWRRWLPGLAQVMPPAPGAWRADTFAGVSVAILMIPSVLAYAELVGLAPATGLYAASGSMALYALLTQSHRVIVGPDTTIALLAAAVILGGMMTMNRAGVRRLAPYLAGFVLLWFAVLVSGVHATIAGVLAAFTVPVVATPGRPDSPDSGAGPGR